MPGKMPTVMAHQFSRVPRAEIQRSSFDRSHGVKTTFDGGWLVPFYVDEALPGDTFNLSVSAFARLATPLKPVMDNLFLETFFFAVPYRLVWDNFPKMCGEQINPGDSTDKTFPVILIYQAHQTVGSLHDYLGLPITISTPGDYTVNALFHRAYNLIWSTWFRDENLSNSPTLDHGDTPSISTTHVLRQRGKRHDYFTSCLPWPQKGDDVVLPLGVSAPVVYDPTATGYTRIKDHASNNVLVDIDAFITDAAGDFIAQESVGPVNYYANYDPADTLYADLSTATAATINAIREAFQLQRLLERDARGGTRYTEIIRAHFGVVSPDARLQRPEYLGGGSTPINFHPVPQTSASGGGSYQGNLTAYATCAVSGGHGFTKSFTEHCVLLGLVCVRADLTYGQGLDRMFSRETRYDMYWPGLAHLGEQAVLNKEIYFKGVPATDDDVFGYQERYAEYRYKPSKLTGLFRTNVSGTLSSWHLGQHFTDTPTLDETFILDTPPIDRVIAVPSEPHFVFDAYISLKCARPMPMFSVPGLIDHF